MDCVNPSDYLFTIHFVGSFSILILILWLWGKLYLKRKSILIFWNSLITFLILTYGALLTSTGRNFIDRRVNAIFEDKNDKELDFNLELSDQQWAQIFSVNDQASQFIIYFGYTFCPDVCPTSLQNIKSLLRKIDGKKPQVIFITLDPIRDTDERLIEYMSFFDKEFKFLRMKEDLEIQNFAKGFKAQYKLNKKSEKDLNYSVDHSARLYFVNRNKKLLFSTAHEETVDKIYSKYKLIQKKD